MLRRFVLFVLVLWFAGAMTAAAQYSGGAGQTVNCSSPLEALSPACSGASMNQAGSGGQSFGSNSQGGYSPGYSGGGGNMPSLYGGYGATSMPRNAGVDNRVPTYVDQAPYGYPMQGAYRYPYNPYAQYRQPRKPQPPTEFQRVVAGATGATLPIFGANLFRNAPFTPINHAPVTADYVIGPGDQLLIRVWGQVNFNVHATVDRSGDIYVPQVGNVQVSGLHFDQLNGYLRKKFGRVFRNFDLSVNMGQLRSIQIYVVGNARYPGSYTVSSLSTLVNALFSSGGPSPQGTMRRIQLKRGGRTVTTFDLYDLLIDGDKSNDAPLLPGDVIYIPPVGPQVAVAGSVHVPAIYELKGDETAGQAIQMAGGLATMAARQNVQLERTGPQGTRQSVQIGFKASGPDTRLQDGDILRVPAMVQRFNDTVTLRGNVANPGRYRWTPGMRIDDLIPSPDALETRGYWQRRVALGLPALEYTPMFSAYQASLPSTEQKQAASAAAPKSYTTGTSLADTEAEQSGAQPISTASAATTKTGSKSSTAGGSAMPVRKSQGERLRYNPPGQRFSESQFPIRNEVLRIAPSIDWSYAVIERTNPVNLTTSLVPFSLGQAVLNHNPAQNLLLKPGDVVTVFSTADIQVPQAQQVKYVSIEGEVAHAGVYSVRPGETLRDVVRRAGGLTPRAYLYGSEFLRESTQRLQQARLTDYVNTLQREIQLAAANASGSIVNPTGAAALGTSIQSQRDLIATLRKLRSTGRIVLNVTPYSHGMDALPNLALQDGDRFIVPTVPATVNVVGAVYDQNSFLYKRGDKIGDYLKIAGGGTRDADKRHEFVIRADGSVISKQTVRGTLFTPGFSRQLSYPGDTVVVPANVNKTSFLRYLTDYSTVLSNFGIGVAAINLLK